MTTPAKESNGMRSPFSRRTAGGAALSCAVALLASASLGVAPAQSADLRRCANVFHTAYGFSSIGVRARGVSCRTARRLAGQRVRAQRNGCVSQFTCRVGTWTCRTAKTRFGMTENEPKWDCRRSGARVVFQDVKGRGR